MPWCLRIASKEMQVHRNIRVQKINNNPPETVTSPPFFEPVPGRYSRTIEG